MGRLASEVALHRAALASLRDELARCKEALSPSSATFTTLANTRAALKVTGDAVEVLGAGLGQDICDLDGGGAVAVEKMLLGAASSLGALQPAHSHFCESLAAAAGQKQQDMQVAGTGKPRSKSKAREPVDFSAFTRARWEAERLKAASMLGGGDTSGDGDGGSGVKVWMNEMPKPFQEEKPCTQVKGRHIMVNTAEKVRKVYVEISVSGQIDRVGFIRAANLARFTSLATERSDCPSGKKGGGDMGWISKTAASKFSEVAFATPKGACSPPFKSQNGFHMFFCEERK